MQAAMRTFVDEQEFLQTDLLSEKNKKLSFVSEGSTDDGADGCSSETSSSLDLAEFTGDAPTPITTPTRAKPAVVSTFVPNFGAKAVPGVVAAAFGGARQVNLSTQLKAGEGREVHDLDFTSTSGSGVSNWTTVNTTIGENQKITLGFQLVFGDELQVRVKEFFREYVAGAHAHYKFEVILGLQPVCGNNWAGPVVVHIPDHRAPKRHLPREVQTSRPLHECFSGRVSLLMEKMDGPVEAELQYSCLCCA
jgi:hypothetical protein